MEKNTSWCPVPWKSVSIRNNGDYRVCCHANTSSSKGILRREDGSAYNAKNADFQELRNSPLLKEIRQDMLAGKRHEVCVRCNMEDDSNVRSRRFYETELWKEKFGIEEAKKASGEGGVIDGQATPIGFYDVRFGNLCNLKCRMCGPTDSSLWHKEHFETTGKGFQDTTGRVVLEKDINGRVQIQGENPYNWHESNSFWSQIENNLHGVQRIHCVGGEPLLIERHYELLRKIIEAGRAKDIVMDYTSNITLIPPKALELWKEFKEVRIGASIDGVGKIDEYIRHPSKWENIERNLNLLDNAEGNLQVWITATVQIYNIFHFTDFLKWKILKNFRKINTAAKTPFLTTHPLHNPPHFNIKALPLAAKHRAIEKFNEFYQDWFLPYVHESEMNQKTKENWIFRMNALLESYKSLMLQADLSHHLPKFMEVTNAMDKYRGESFEETMPELAGYIHDELKKKGHISLDRSIGAEIHPA